MTETNTVAETLCLENPRWMKFSQNNNLLLLLLLLLQPLPAAGPG
jgi:hypothetical protein